MIHLPALRLGKPYESLDRVTLVHHATGEPVAEVSQVTGSMIARDLSRGAASRHELSEIPIQELVGMYAHAAEFFMSATLPCGSSEQSFDEYLRCLSATTGSPLVFCRRNAEKVAYVLGHVAEVVNGLTRGLDLATLDAGYGQQDGRMQSFYPATDYLGAVLPSNSPGVHALWTPTIALKIPLVIKPGREEPWTPMRVLQSLMKAGVPASACSFYPTDHSGAGDLLRLCGRSMLFGDTTTTDPYKHDPRIEIHGPGFSKVLIGDDQAGRWETHLDAMIECIAANGGRSCINVSSIWTPRHGQAIAEALADRLSKVKPRPWDDPAAEISAFANPQVAEAINGMIDQALQTQGAIDLTEQKRGSPRLVREGRCAWLLPTIVYCEKYDHPLAQKECLFPCAAVVECPQDEMLAGIGPTLATMALTENAELRRVAARLPADFAAQHWPDSHNAPDLGPAA